MQHSSMFREGEKNQRKEAFEKEPGQQEGTGGESLYRSTSSN
jgi:hypothetical protein